MLYGQLVSQVSQEEFERMYDIKTNCIQFQGIIHAIKDFAGKHSVINFTKKNTKNAIYSRKYISPNQIKKGGKDFYDTLNKNDDKPSSQHKWENTY